MIKIILLVICNVRNLWRSLFENVENEKNKSKDPPHLFVKKNAPSGNRTRVSTLEVSYSTSELSAHMYAEWGSNPRAFALDFLIVLRPTP